MILKRLIRNVADQNWLAVLLEIVVVVIGIFLGIQATNWSEQRQSIAEGYYYLDLLQRQLDAEIKTIEAENVRLSDEINTINSVRELLYADSWSEDEFAQFKSDHLVIYKGVRMPRRPPALRLLLDAGKIDLVESPAMQEMLLSLDSDYASAIGQTEIFDEISNEATMILSRAIPYGTRDDLMAIPVDPDVLLQSEELKWSVRMMLIMKMIQLSVMNELQSACTEASDELQTYLSSYASSSSQ